MRRGRLCSKKDLKVIIGRIFQILILGGRLAFAKHIHNPFSNYVSHALLVIRSRVM